MVKEMESKVKKLEAEKQKVDRQVSSRLHLDAVVINGF